MDRLEFAGANQLVELCLANIEHAHGAIDPDANR
jgi:hypothetical protein